MERKQKGNVVIQEVASLRKLKSPIERNMASFSPFLAACKDMSDDRKKAIDDMDFKSLRNIKCDTMFNHLSQWLAGLYDLDSREVVVPGRGRIPVNEESVHQIMGVPRGGDNVTYKLPTQAELQLAGELFGELGYVPKNEELLELITSSNNSDTNFKRMWLMLAGNTVIAPTTSNNVNTRWYAVLQDIDNVCNLNWSKFIADELHKALLEGKPTKGCLLFYNLLYIDAIDLTGLGIVLPDGDFAINVWTNELISEVLSKDIQMDNTSYGKLALKPKFGMDLCLFGGFQGLDKFMRVHAAPNCSGQKLDKASALVGCFSSRMMGLLGKIVHGVTSMDDEGSPEVSCQLETCLRGLSPAIGNTARTPPSTHPNQKNIPSKQLLYESYTNDQSQGGGDNDDSDSDDDKDYRIVFHTQAGPYNASGSGDRYLDAEDSSTTEADLSASGAANDEGTPICVGDGPILESQIMLTKPCRTASVDEGEGMLNQQDMTNTLVEVACESSLKRCSASLVKPLDITYTRRKKLRLPSPSQPVAPVHPALLFEAERDYHVKSIGFQELGIHIPDKGTGESIPRPSWKKQDSPRISTKHVDMAKASSNVSGTRSRVSSLTYNSSCDMTSSQKKVRKAVRKVSVSKSRTSTHFRATPSQPPQKGVVDIIEPSMVTSPNEVAQACVTGSPASSQAAATYECATDVLAVTSPIVYGEAIHQLATGTTSDSL